MDAECFLPFPSLFAKGMDTKTPTSLTKGGSSIHIVKRAKFPILFLKPTVSPLRKLSVFAMLKLFQIRRWSHVPAIPHFSALCPIHLEPY